MTNCTPVYSSTSTLILLTPQRQEGSAPVVLVTGHEGQPIHITCSYLSKDSEKYFCRGELASDCVTNGIKVAEDQKGQDRFSLREEATSNIFTVTITDLRAENAGIYWCGEYEHKYLFTSAVHLEVRRGELI